MMLPSLPSQWRPDLVVTSKFLGALLLRVPNAAALETSPAKFSMSCSSPPPSASPSASIPSVATAFQLAEFRSLARPDCFSLCFLRVRSPESPGARARVHRLLGKPHAGLTSVVRPSVIVFVLARRSAGHCPRAADGAATDPHTSTYSPLGLTRPSQP